jgi:hypothetical protein
MNAPERLSQTKHQQRQESRVDFAIGADQFAKPVPTITREVIYGKEGE